MNKLTPKERARILACLVEGNSMRATQRLTGFAKKTVERTLREAGEACTAMMDRRLVNLPCRRIQCDEIWAFVGCKQANATTEQREEKDFGDCWTWVALDPDTKLVAGWYVGDRTASSAYAMLRPLQKRLANKVQLTTDGHHAYLVAVESAFAWTELDFAQLVKVYGGASGHEVRYSPGEFRGTETHVIKGAPDPASICTSHVERQNLTIRMGIRRFTRLTNGFSKSLASHKHAVALHFAHYNFCRIHQTLRVTPAMQAGLTDHVWGLTELLAVGLAARAAA